MVYVDVLRMDSKLFYLTDMNTVAIEKMHKDMLSGDVVKLEH